MYNPGPNLPNVINIDFKEAQKLTRSYKSSLILWNVLGISAAQIGKLDKAVLAFKKALDIKPNHAEAYNKPGNYLD